MPTGYTAELYEGKDVTFESFVLTCARAMGAAIMQRDDPAGPIADEYEPSDYEARALTKAEARLAELQEYRADDWKKLEATDRADQTKGVNEAIEKAAARRVRYESMLAQVEAWRVPTTEHLGLKDFMIEQLKSSIDFDCRTTYLTIPSMVPWEEFKIAKLTAAQLAVERCKESLAKELERTESRNKWVRDLRNSLSKPVAV